jgi:hypothetical protein
MLDTAFARSSLSSLTYGSLSFHGLTTLLLWPRAALLRADLEAAIGDKAAARAWYKEFLDLWDGADAEFQPVVIRARTAYRRLTNG